MLALSSSWGVEGCQALGSSGSLPCHLFYQPPTLLACVTVSPPSPITIAHRKSQNNQQPSHGCLLLQSLIHSFILSSTRATELHRTRNPGSIASPALCASTRSLGPRKISRSNRDKLGFGFAETTHWVAEGRGCGRGLCGLPKGRR